MATKERGILFNGDMVRAILAGRKTVTRRPVKLNASPTVGGWDYFHDAEHSWEGSFFHPKGDVPDSGDFPSTRVRSPFGATGNLLYVRETWYCDHYLAHCDDLGDAANEQEKIEQMQALTEYRASHECAAWEAGCPCSDENGKGSWRPSIHMPKWAARIWLRVEDVRVERLQEITFRDQGLEGFEQQATLGRHRDFAATWEDIYAADGLGWDANPWVWRCEFERVDKPGEGS